MAGSLLCENNHKIALKKENCAVTLLHLVLNVKGKFMNDVTILKC